MVHKLYFRYGTMNSSKTANLIMVAHNYKRLNKKIIIIKPNIDTRFHKENIVSRTGLEVKTDYTIDTKTNIFKLQNWDDVDCVLVDEVSFLTEKQIDELRKITKYSPVITYGLRTDYKTKLFPATKRLFELCDTIEEIKNICSICVKKKSLFNMKIDINGSPIKDGSSDIDIGGEDKYISVCYECYNL